ncbi:MAG: hypothetical protein US49_C0006G0068 [candidate division TM6 bacterium GW2011_GWF2_37_49]|nr:MAG: hypothetical protein US49_C0006G0068 [candidate division TM6 bacterium GW2011_GWF2_37_49]
MKFWSGLFKNCLIGVLTCGLILADGLDNFIGLDEIPLDVINQVDADDDINSQTRMSNTELVSAAVVFRDISAPHTKAPAGRDILYHMPYKMSSIQYGGIVTDIFVNVTNKMNVSSGSILSIKKQEPFIKSVFLLFMEAMPEDEASSVVPILQNITISEYKVGAFLQGGFVKDFFNIQIHIPVLIGIRHFWLSPSDQRELRSIFSKYENESLDESEFYRIRYGFGDTRFRFGCNTLNMTDFQTDVGLEFIIPTSKLSNNPKLKSNPDDLFAQINDGQKGDQKNTDLQDSMASIVRNVRDYLIDPRLGNGHFGIGAYIESKFDVFHDLAHLWMRASYDKLFPDVEYRLFMFKKTMEPNELVPDPELLRNGLMQDFVRQYVFPASFKSEVYPGGVFNFVFAASTLVNHVNLALGYDYYAQQKESIRKLYNTTTSLQSLRVSDAESDSTEQHKIFAEASYIKNLKRVDLGFGLGGDVTVHSSGIGEDWTVYFKIAGTF